MLAMRLPCTCKPIAHSRSCTVLLGLGLALPATASQAGSSAPHAGCPVVHVPGQYNQQRLQAWINQSQTSYTLTITPFAHTSPPHTQAATLWGPRV